MDKRGWTEKLPKWLLSWMASLLPTQSSSGDGAVNIGQVTGDVHHVTNHVHAAPQPAVTMHVTQVIYSEQPAANGTANAEQREVLAQIRRMPDRGDIAFRFMLREFNTRMVIDLRPTELRRLQAYVATVNKNMANRPTQGTTCRESA